jgi:hypothetical protein
MSAPKSDDAFSDEETERRVKDALRRALSTPARHKPSAKAAKPKERLASKARARNGAT